MKKKKEKQEGAMRNETLQNSANLQKQSGEWITNPLFYPPQK
jgi:hypothetical protein